MLRSILGAIAGYFVMFVFIFVTFSGLFLALGTERTFEPGSYQVSTVWIVISTVLGLIAAVAGGYVASMAGNGFTAVKILAGIVLIMGALTVAMVVMSPAPTEPRTADVANMEAMTKAQTPLWIAILNPIIGIVGSIVGGRIRKD